MALRKTSKADLKKDYRLFVQVGLVMTLLLLIGAFKLNMESNEVQNIAAEEQEIFEMEEIVRTQQIEQPPPPPKPPEPIEVPDEEELEDVDLNLDAELDLDAAPADLPPPPPPPAPTPQKQEEPEPEIFVVVEQQPELIGGLPELQSKINYPEIAKRAGVEGRVIVQFVVDEQGNVRDPFVVRGIGAGCDEEALRAVRTAKFKPGKQRGKAVKVQMTLPITFRLR